MAAGAYTIPISYAWSGDELKKKSVSFDFPPATVLVTVALTHGTIVVYDPATGVEIGQHLVVTMPGAPAGTPGEAADLAAALDALEVDAAVRSTLRALRHAGQVQAGRVLALTRSGTGFRLVQKVFVPPARRRP